jgi:alkanesulfonate monooxygenase SsuD/methylene tetrahydromethanopterin reductase-like flavin-dependent oxidoreductase (luciferase family)
MDALEIYRSRFRPSPKLAKPYVMLGFNVFAADTDEEAELLSTSVQQAFVNLRTGRPTQLPPPVKGYGDKLAPQERAIIDSALSCTAMGAREKVRSQIEAFSARTNANELMITSQIFDHTARLHSYEIVASIMGP